MSIFSTQTAESVECPKCGKRTIVQGSSYQYHCLNCNFHRDLSSKMSTGRRGSERGYSRSDRSYSSSRSRGRDSGGRSDFSRDFGGLDLGRGSREMGGSRDFAMPRRDRESEMNPFLFVLIAIIFGLLVL